jgi:hypothetical protein
MKMLNDKDLLEKVKVISLVVIAISLAMIAFRLDDIIDLLASLVNKG